MHCIVKSFAACAMALPEVVGQFVASDNIVLDMERVASDFDEGYCAFESFDEFSGKYVPAARTTEINK